MPRTNISNGADLISAVAAESNEELATRLAEDFALMGAAQARVVIRLGEYERRQAFRDEGATSLESWSAERFGISTSTARTYAQLGEKAWDIPNLVGSLSRGDISFDKVRALADVATPESDRELTEQAKDCSVRELAEIARATAERERAAAAPRADGRFVRFNDAYRSISAQLPADAYAETKARIDAQLKEIPSDGDTPLDQRRCDALLGLLHSSGGVATSAGRPFLVVAHVPLTALIEDADEHSTLAGELEQQGLIDGETVQRLACDATVVVAVDDERGHTMYEGRAKRFPTDTQRREVMRRDRHCRFPGCTNVTFTNVHHIVPWKPGGRTNLDNMALLCIHHHGLAHRRDWTMSGNANEELTFVGPSGRVMTSHPSPLWTRVTARSRSG